MQNKEKDSKMDQTIGTCEHTVSKGESWGNICDSEVRELAGNDVKRIMKKRKTIASIDRYTKCYATEREREYNLTLSLAYFTGEWNISEDGKIDIVPDMEWFDSESDHRAYALMKSKRNPSHERYTPFRCTECKKAWSNIYNSRSYAGSTYEYLYGVFSNMHLKKKVCPNCNG